MNGAAHKAVPSTPMRALTPQLARALAGKFLVFDGPDGSGKSTQLRRFLDAARDAGLDPCEVREPGGTEIGEKIRRALLDHLEEDMTLRCEMLLYMASRAQLVEQTIRPALDAGRLVVADRFVSSTLAYQGAAGGLPEEDIRAAARIACGDVTPDLVVIFDVDEDTAAGRLNPLLDRMESKGREYHRRVREGYLAQIQRDPRRHLRVDASRGEDEVFGSLIEGLKERLT
ncbi:MAG: dTMP kinase [Phycisphaerales bacterium]